MSTDKPQDLNPTINDPKFWIVECEGGNERDIAIRLIAHAKESRLLILSAIALDHLKAYIYVEAYKESDVREACKIIGDKKKNRKIRLVPLNERCSILSIENISRVQLKVEPSRYSKGDQVIILKGEHKGSTAVVESIKEGKLHMSLSSNHKKSLALGEEDVEKNFVVGNQVKVVCGDSAGTKGIVIRSEKDIVTILSEAKEHVTTNANNLELCSGITIASRPRGEENHFKVGKRAKRGRQ